MYHKCFKNNFCRLVTFEFLKCFNKYTVIPNSLFSPNSLFFPNSLFPPHSLFSPLLSQVSYVKAVDVWIETCTWLVFCALLEFPFVNFIARKGKENDAIAAANAAAQNATNRVTAPNKLFQVSNKKHQ